MPSCGVSGANGGQIRMAEHDLRQGQRSLYIEYSGTQNFIIGKKDLAALTVIEEHCVSE
jgi:hypothetical protein